MDLGLNGKTAIVGGASMGIGYGIARQLALEGAAVVITARREKGLQAAAEKLGLSKSLVSRQVSALERTLAVRLLNRSTRRLSLTEAGSLFHEHCVRVVLETLG